MSVTTRVKSRVLMTSSAAVLGFALASLVAGSAAAQDQSGQQESKAPEIVVTGSRIVRRDFNSQSSDRHHQLANFRESRQCWHRGEPQSAAAI